MKINFDSIAIDSLERFGLIIKPSLLNASSLKAELAGAANKVGYEPTVVRRGIVFR